jgi:hypothetical protein
VLPSPDLTMTGPALMLPESVTSAKAGAANSPPTAKAITVLFISFPRRACCGSVPILQEHVAPWLVCVARNTHRERGDFCKLQSGCVGEATFFAQWQRELL